MLKINNLAPLAGASLLVLTTGLANAGSYWQNSSGAPIKDSNGACVKAGLAKHKVAACKPADRVILLPGNDGKVGAVLVSSQGTNHRLDEAYKTVSSSADGLAEKTLSAGEVKGEFGQLLKALPDSVTSFTVKFVSGSATELTPESQAVIQQLKAELERREAPEIRLVGHTDSVGNLLQNDQLSRKRAQTVADVLIGYGIAKEVIEATGRGEREPAVATADNVSEAANRRVDIRVR